jgi:hypothetical protein
MKVALQQIGTALLWSSVATFVAVIAINIGLQRWTVVAWTAVEIAVVLFLIRANQLFDAWREALLEQLASQRRMREVALRAMEEAAANGDVRVRIDPARKTH